MRVFSAEAAVPLSAMRGGKMDDVQWEKLTRRVTQIENAPILHKRECDISQMEPTVCEILDL